MVSIPNPEAYNVTKPQARCEKFSPTSCPSKAYLSNFTKLKFIGQKTQSYKNVSFLLYKVYQNVISLFTTIQAFVYIYTFICLVCQERKKSNNGT